MADAAGTALDQDCSFFELDFVDAVGARRQESLTTCWNVAFESVDPVRSFRWAKGQKHFPGWWWSATSARHVGYESWLERDRAMLLDFDREVAGFASQPFWLHWQDTKRWRRHAPDFFARNRDGAGGVVDVRADDRIEVRDAEAFKVMAEACAEVGRAFRRVGVADPVLAANVRWLSRYRHPRNGARQDIAEALLAIFSEPTPLFVGAETVGDRIAVLPVLFHLLWQQRLVTDLTRAPLSAAATALLVQYGRGRHSADRSEGLGEQDPRENTADKSAQDILMLFSMIPGEAVDEELIGSNPCRNGPTPPPTKRTRRPGG
ncbi:MULTISPECIES: TnsA-like heteromeric transposase endonuclease subunit [Amycolatopsis]|uniref:TnsA-like heteromeric transposase endonuclease subunit n=1 Tax=Amycolatopsis albidoflavus TaxID=102226 RepID=A0ABW5I4S8_9PSEU